MNGRIGLVLQARLGSSRLPGKALETLSGVSIVERCLNRLKLADAGQVVLATTEAPEDDALAAVAHRLNVAVYRGSCDDVVERYLGAARAFNLDIVVRATGDNPAVDIDAPKRVIGALDSSDYACELGLPYGAGVEAVTVAALRMSDASAESAYEREHVTVHIKNRPDRFRLTRLAAPRALARPDVRVTIDTADDLAYMRRVFACTGHAEPTLAQVITAVDSCNRSATA